MPRRKRSEETISAIGAPATSPEGREQELINLSMNLAEQRLRDGTASSAEVVHFLRLATNKSKLEEAKLRQETAMIEAKTKMVSNMEDTKKLMAEALNAMRRYQGGTDEMEIANDFD